VCRKYKLARLNWCCQLLLYKKTHKDCIYVSVGIVWLSYVRARQCTRTQSLQDGWVSGWRDTWLQPHVRCLVLTQWTFLISEPDQVYHRSRVATDSTSWDKQACTHGTLWRQRYVTTSKEYLINSHFLLKYFELVFLWLRLVKISCTLIIISLNYERKKKGHFWWNTVWTL